MNRKKELLKNTAIIFVGRFCTQFISFILIPIYTHYLSTKDYGYVDVVQTYISLIIPIILLRLDSSIFRFLIDIRDSKEKQKSIITNSYLFMCIQIIIFTLSFFVLNHFFNFKYSIAILLNGIFVAISSILLQMARGLGKNLDYSISSIIAGILTIIFNLIFLLKFKLDGSSILYASTIANIGCSIYLIIKTKLLNLINFKSKDKKKFKEMLDYSLPMIPDGLSWWIVNVLDRTIITFLLSASSNGIYAISSKFSNILSSVYQIFNMSWQESASLHINDEDSSSFFSDTLNNVYKIFFSICVIILVLMPFIFRILIGKKYLSAYLYIPPLLLGNLYNATANVIGGIYIAKKNTKIGARTTIFCAIINIVLNLIFIKKIGLFAASLSTLISYVVLTFYRYIDAQKYLKIKFNYSLLFYSTFYYCIIVVIYYYNNFILNVISLILSIIVIICLNKQIIIEIYKFKKIRKGMI